MTVSPLRAQPRDVAQDRAISSRLQPSHQSIRRRSVARQLLACAVAVGCSLAARADEYWVGGSGNWDDLLWSAKAGGSPGLPPPTTGNAYLTFNDALTRTVTFVDAGIAPNLSTFQIGNAGTGQSVLAQSADTMSVTALLVNAGGRYTLDGGASTLTVSGAGTVQAGGSFAIDAGAFTTGGGLALTNASVFQSGGAVSVQGLILNGTNGSTYTMSGGTLSAANGTVRITSNVNGNFIQAGGAATFDWLNLGTTTSNVGTQGGTYSMSGGASLVVNQVLRVGDGFLAAAFNQGAGSVRTVELEVASEVTIGTNRLGSYSIGDGGTLDVADGIALGSVTFTQTGGAVTAGWLGSNLNATPAVTISGGILLAPGTSRLYGPGASLLQTGGTVHLGALYVTDCTLDGNAALTVDGDLRTDIGLSGGQFTLRHGTATLGGAVALIGPGMTISGGTLDVGGPMTLYRATSPSIAPTWSQTAGDVRAASLQVGGYEGNDNGTYYLSGGTLTATNGVSTIGAFTQANFVQSGGTFTASALTVGGSAPGNVGSSFALSGGDLRVTGNMTVKSASYSQAGGNAVLGGTFSVNAPFSGAPSAAAVLSGGTLTAGLVSNAASFAFSGGTLAAPVVSQDPSNSRYNPLTNKVVFTLTGAGTRTLSTLLNGALVQVNNTTVQFVGGATNNAAYISNGSDNGFVTLTNGPAAFLQGGPGDHFRLSGDLLSSSTNAANWQTGASTLEFQLSAANSHTLSVTGTDLGGDTLNGYASNFAWGTLQLDVDQSLILQDGNAMPGGALYVEVVSLADGLEQIQRITGNGLNVYYDATDPANAYLGGQSYPLVNGGELIGATPEPGAMAGLLAVGVTGCLWRRARRPARQVVCK